MVPIAEEIAEFEGVLGRDPIPLKTIPDEGLIIEDGIISGFRIPEEEAWKLVPDIARDRDFPYFKSISLHVIECVEKYASLKADNEDDSVKRNIWKKISDDLSQSELLSRIIDGQEVYIVPPPKSYKSTWYKLLDAGEDIADKVNFSNWKTGVGSSILDIGKDKYAIIDDSPWEIKETIGEKPDISMIVSYSDLAPDYLLRKATPEEQARLLHARQDRSSTTNRWILIRREKNDDSGDTSG